MAEASVPVDLFNPGQVFACFGFLEAADVLLGDAEGAFDWTSPTSTRFVLRARGEESPVERVLRFLTEANVVALAPHGSRHKASWLKTWGPVEVVNEGRPYPFANPSSPATLVAALRAGTDTIDIDHWGDSTKRDNVKFWAGSRGYPGSGFTRDALALVRKSPVNVASDPFALAVAQSSSFRLDWRCDYIPIDAGFSLNEHKKNMKTVGYPLVELLAAIGLGNSRPVPAWAGKPREQRKLRYRYAVVGRAPGMPDGWYAPSLLRAALGGAELPLPSRRFHMSLGWPGKAGQARSITTVIEETAP